VGAEIIRPWVRGWDSSSLQSMREHVPDGNTADHISSHVHLCIIENRVVLLRWELSTNYMYNTGMLMQGLFNCDHNCDHVELHFDFGKDVFIRLRARMHNLHNIFLHIYLSKVHKLSIYCLCLKKVNICIGYLRLAKILQARHYSYGKFGIAVDHLSSLTNCDR
jgi:hypothetical protein